MRDILLSYLVKVEKGELTPADAVEEVVKAAKAELGDEIVIRE